MQSLSLQGPEPPSVSRPTRAEAVVLSLAAHIVLFLIVIYAPEHLPGSILRLLGAGAVVAAPSTRTGSPPGAKPAEDSLQPAPAPRPKESKIPLKFAYVRVPEEPVSAKNPEARLLSDRDRRARQEVPTPPDARRFSLDPHAEGNSRDRIRPDPTRPEGPDTLDPVSRTGGSRRAGGSAGNGPAVAEGAEKSGVPATEPRVPATGSGAGAPARPTTESAGGDSLSPRSGPGGGEAADDHEGPPGDPSRQALPDVRGGTEYKFSFSNPGWLRGQAFGTLSFDTQGFPWGEYARQLYVIIRNNWLSRIPLAAREGIAGYTCQHFLIARAGDISDIEIVRSSAVPPFNKAAGDALRASSPLPPLPEEFPNPQEGVTFCFYYNMYPGEAD